MLKEVLQQLLSGSTFDNYIGIDNDFTKYLKDGCFSIKCLSNYSLACKISAKLSGSFWAL